MNSAPSRPPLFDPAALVLFQGDSITEGGRGHEDDPPHALGHGYPFLIAAAESEAFPERRVSFLNRAAPGNTCGDLLARWQADALEFRPDVISILVGAHDILRQLGGNTPYDATAFEAAYDKLLAETLISVPNARLILGEPFFALGKETLPQIDRWPEVIRQAGAAVNRLAVKYRAAVVRYPQLFDEAAKRAPSDHWIWDGLHPTCAGHQLMARAWAQTYREAFGPPGELPQTA